MITAKEIRNIQSDAMNAAERATVLAMTGDKAAAAEAKTRADALFEKANAAMIEQYGRVLSFNDLAKVEHDEECVRLGLPLETSLLALWDAQAAEAASA